MSLKALRVDAGLSQQQLAVQSGLNIRTVQRLEQGQRASFKTLQALANGLALPVAQLKQHVALQDAAVVSPQRMVFLDNLRSFLVFLVVFYHCGLVYESSGIGAYFWLVDDAASNDLSGVFNLVIDTFVMFGLFFIAGYFAPGSLRGKAASEFILTKFKRLLLPWLFSVLTLLPLYKVIFLASRGLPQEHWSSYFHFSNGIIGQSWLWFLPILFLFELAIFMAYKANLRLASAFQKFSAYHVVALLFVLCVLIGVAFKLTGLNGWTKTWLLDFQNERLLMYFVVFVTGVWFYSRQIFHRDWQTKKLTLLVNCTAWLPINLYLLMVIYPLIHPGQYLISHLVDALLKQVSLQLSMLMLLYSVIICSKRFFNTSSKVGDWINRNSYGTYLVHTVVLGVIALTLQPLVLPSILKYAILVVTTYVSCQIMVSLYKMSITSVKP